MARYGVFVCNSYESWMEEFDTLEEARARVHRWETADKPDRSPIQVTLVRIISEHKEGSAS